MDYHHFNRIVNDVGNKDSILCGDVNYNLLNVQHHRDTEEYYNNLQANSYIPLITKPTRITETSATLIDHIFINNLDSNDRSNTKCGIIISDLSDHLPVLL